MPAFHLDENGIFDVTAFLDELSTMGVGVARRLVPIDPMIVRGAIDRHLQASPVPEPVQRGHALFMQNCTACHVPLQATALGLQTAPDLTTVTQRLDDDGLRQTLVDGRVPRGMPAWQHLGSGVDDLTAFLRWLCAERDALCEQCGGVGEPQPLPWWEYR
jgi:hypothetical protein